MRIRLTIEYDGTNFCGWQTQPSLRTVQSELEAAVYKLTGEESRVTASGRTDAGVHAIGQVAHFDTDKDLGQKFVSGLNYYLPEDIRIRRAEVAENDFHARFSAKQKTYVYLMYESPTDSPLLRYRATRTDKMDADAMNDACSAFLGEKDFAAFRSTGSDTATTVRTVSEASVKRRGEFIVFSVTADGFLYNMVRKMAAALIEVGYKKMSKEEVCSLLNAGAVFTRVAPPQGLYLLKVEYGKKSD